MNKLGAYIDKPFSLNEETVMLNILVITAFVIAYLSMVSIAWNQAPDEENLSDEEREAALMNFYHP